MYGIFSEPQKLETQSSGTSFSPILLLMGFKFTIAKFYNVSKVQKILVSIFVAVTGFLVLREPVQRS